MNTMLKTACLSILAFGLLAAAPAMAKPALWVAHKDNSTMYLFGTTTALPDGVEWRYPMLIRAMRDSQVLYVDVANTDRSVEAAAMARYGADHVHPLSSKIPAADMKRLGRIADNMGLKGGVSRFQSMNPWMVSMTLDIASLIRAGLDLSNNPTGYIRDQYKAAGRGVIGLETPESVIRIIADAPESVQVEGLHQDLAMYDKIVPLIRRMDRDWQRGNVADMWRMMDTYTRKQTPEIYRYTIADVDRRWGKQLAQAMQQPGTRFAAIDMENLIGPDGIIKQLKARGIQVRRLH